MSLASLQFLNRIYTYPLVEDTYGHVASYYSWAKSRYALLNATCTLAEAGVVSVANYSKPLADRYCDKAKVLDDTLCKGLDQIEHYYPIVKKPSSSVIQDGKDLLKPKMDKILLPYKNVRNCATYYYDKGNKTLETGKENVQKLCESGRQITISLLDSFDKYIEKNYPKDIEMKVMGEEDSVKSNETDLFHLTFQILSKSQRRVYASHRRKVLNLQRLGVENLHWLKENVTDLQYVQSVLQRGTELNGEFWTTLNKIKENVASQSHADELITADHLGQDNKKTTSFLGASFISDIVTLKKFDSVTENANLFAQTLSTMVYARLDDDQIKWLRERKLIWNDRITHLSENCRWVGDTVRKIVFSSFHQLTDHVVEYSSIVVSMCSINKVAFDLSNLNLFVDFTSEEELFNN